MSISSRRWLVACGALYAVSRPVEARGADAPEHVVLTYAAPQGCPQEAAFVAEVDARRRGGGDEKTTPARGGRTFDVGIERIAEARFRGTLRVTDGDDVRERVAEESQCGGLVRVLAVFTALAIDVDPRVEDAPPPPPAAPTPKPPAVLPDDPPTVPSDVDLLPSSSLDVRRVPPMVRVGVSFAVRIDFSQGGSMTAAVDLSRERPNGWAPALRIGGVRSISGWSYGERDFSLPTSSGSTTLDAGFLDLCPLRYDFVDLYIQSCFRGEVGTFETDANVGVPGLLSGTRQTPWASVGATAGLRANVWSHFFLELEAGLEVPMNNVRIDVANGQTAYATGTGSWVGLGFGGYLVAIKIPTTEH